MQFVKSRSELGIAFRQVTAYLQAARNTLARFGRRVAEKASRLRKALREKENSLQKLLANSVHALVVMNGKIAKLRARLFKKTTARFRGTQNTLARFGRRVADKPQRLREALHERENSLQKLLANSVDALVVTNNHHRFVAANPRALDLFGISKSNMRQFTIDVFLTCDQIRDFNGNGSPLTRQKERYGKCKIRRLDGTFRVAEYVFVAHFTPLRHLSTFREVTWQKVQVTLAGQLNRASTLLASTDQVQIH